VKAVVQTAQFKRDLKKVKRSGRYKVDDLLVVVELLSCWQRISRYLKIIRSMI